METTFFDENFIPSYEYLDTLLEDLEFSDTVVLQEIAQAERDLFIDIIQEDFLMEGIVGSAVGGASHLAGAALGAVGKGIGKAGVAVSKGIAIGAAVGTVALGAKIFNMFKNWFMKLRDFLIKVWHKMILYIENVVKWVTQSFTSFVASLKDIKDINVREGSLQSISLYSRYSQGIIAQIYKTYNLNYWYEKFINFVDEIVNGAKVPIEDLENLRKNINRGRIVKVSIDNWKAYVNSVQTVLNNNKLAIHEINRRFRDAISKNDQKVAKLENMQSNELIEQEKTRLTNYGKNLTAYRKACHDYIEKLVTIGKELFKSLLYGSKLERGDMENAGNSIKRSEMNSNIPNEQAKQQQAQASLQQ